MDSLKVLTSFIISMCALGLCGNCVGEFGILTIGCKVGPLGEHTKEYKVESPWRIVIGH